MTNNLNIIDNSPFFYFLPLFASFFLLESRGASDIPRYISRSSIIIEKDLILNANFASIVWHFYDKNEGS